MCSFYDPTRQKKIKQTPEEQVRQKLLGWLHTEKKVPLHLMSTEWSLKNIQPGLKDRIDLVVHQLGGEGHLRSPWLLSECKAQSLPQSSWGPLIAQVQKYCQWLSPRYLILQLGEQRHIFQQVHMDSQSSQRQIHWQPLADLPEYVSK